MNELRTIFFVIGRGLVNRNILRTGVLERVLADERVRVVLIYHRVAEPLPAYLHEEFRHPRVVIEQAPEHQESSIALRLWKPTIQNLVYTTSTDLLARRGSAKVKPVPRWWYPIHRWLFSALSRSAVLKAVVRWLELFFFPVRAYDALFKKYQPSVVFCGSVISKYDMGFLKAARRHRVPSVGMQKGWDNLERQLIQVLPDQLLVQNAIMAEAAERVQSIPRAKIRVVGFPQFDAYAHADALPPRRQVLTRLGIPTDAKLVLFGSEGLWTPTDENVIEDLLLMRDRGEFPFDVWFAVRPHFSDAAKKRYARYHGRAGVYADDGYRWGTFFADSWDPSRDDMQHFIEELRAADAVICIASTLSLDAACLDIPTLNVCYGATVGTDGTDLTPGLYEMDHYQPVIASGGVVIVRTREELRDALIQCVQNRDAGASGRKRLRERMCGPLDGRAAERIADSILQTGHVLDRREATA